MSYFVLLFSHWPETSFDVILIISLLFKKLVSAFSIKTPVLSCDTYRVISLVVDPSSLKRQSGICICILWSLLDQGYTCSKSIVVCFLTQRKLMLRHLYHYSKVILCYFYNLFRIWWLSHILTKGCGQVLATDLAWMWQA